jgi:hypothetical protein
VGDQFAALAATVTERDLPTEIPAPRLLIGLHLANALANAVTFGLGKGCGDGQEMESNAPLLQALDYLERVEG